VTETGFSSPHADLRSTLSPPTVHLRMPQDLPAVLPIPMVQVIFGLSHSIYWAYQVEGEEIRHIFRSTQVDPGPPAPVVNRSVDDSTRGAHGALMPIGFPGEYEKECNMCDYFTDS
jgi:hypothetical protein